MNLITNLTTDFNYYKHVSTDGDFKKVYGLYRELDTLINILSIRKKTYPGDPEYGSILYYFLFEPADAFTENDIRNEVQRICTQYLKKIRLSKLSVYRFSNLKGFQVYIELQRNEEIATAKLNVTENGMYTE